MEYVREVLDRQTGRLATVSLGNWITVSEMGERMGVGPRQTRSILREMGVLQVETSGPQSHRRHRLCPWVVEREWGRPCERRHAVPFDVLGPPLQTWIEDRWDEAVSRLNKRSKGGEVGRARAAYEAFIGTGKNAERTARELACWLFDHFPRLSYGDVADILSVTPQLVGRFAETRQRQRSVAIASKGGKAGRFDMMCSRRFPA